MTARPTYTASDAPAAPEPRASGSRSSQRTSVATWARSPGAWAWLTASGPHPTASALRHGRDDHDRLRGRRQVAGLEARLRGAVRPVELLDEGVGRLEEADLRR